MAVEYFTWTFLMLTWRNLLQIPHDFVIALVDKYFYWTDFKVTSDWIVYHSPMPWKCAVGFLDQDLCLFLDTSYYKEVILNHYVQYAFQKFVPLLMFRNQASYLFDRNCHHQYNLHLEGHAC